jgi:hypothetical protein
MADVEFTAETQYHNLGRNRYSKPCGIHISVQRDEIHLQAIGCKRHLTQGLRLVVPLAHVRDLRDALNDILASQGNHGR